MAATTHPAVTGTRAFQRIKHNSRLRWALLRRINAYMDLPIALASIAMVLLAMIQLNGHVQPAWQPRLTVLQILLWLLFVIQFVIQFILAPIKTVYLRQH